MKTLDFWFDYSCPYAYLASTQVEALADRADAALSWQPMLLGGVFKAAGTPQNLMNVLSPAKAAHNLKDMQRWAELFAVPLSVPDGHPQRTVEALRATLAASLDPGVIHGFYEAYWVHGVPLSAPETLRGVLAAAGHDPDVVLAAAQSDAYRELLRQRTEQAVSLGVFGAPTFIVNDTQLFWGQDRMAFVEKALEGWDPLAPHEEQEET